MELMTKYVADGRGAAVTVDLPEVVDHPRVQVLPLEGFELLEIAALWNGEPSALVRALLQEGQRYIRELWPQGACEEGLTLLPTPASKRAADIGGADPAPAVRGAG